MELHAELGFIPARSSGRRILFGDQAGPVPLGLALGTTEPAMQMAHFSPRITTQADTEFPHRRP